MSAQPASESSLQPSSKEDELIEWRRECFIALNFSRTQAGALARAKVDHHRAAKMLSQGCSVDLAVKILL
jgi:hypothetical protein